VLVIGVTGQSAMTNRESTTSIPTVRADACSRCSAASHVARVTSREWLRRRLPRRHRQQLGGRSRGVRAGPSRHRRCGFLVAIAGKLQNEYGIDPGRVFATGMSNGGFMSNRLGCDRADMFAAVAPVSGTLGSAVACNPSRPVAVLEVHGTADPLVPFDGGTMRGRGGTSDIVSAPAMVERWRTADGCQGAPATEALPSTGDGTVVHRFASTSCEAGTAVVFYRVDDGGHTWPGGPQYLPTAIIGPTTHAFGASEAIGQFFAAHAH
jgi:polyhydroxybutyrate depolymerase